MKKILVIHTQYTQTGGEDIAVRSEIEFLQKEYEVEKLIFNNTLNLKFSDLIAFIFNKNKESINKLIDKLERFNPDYIYIHNLWFKGSLGILDLILKRNLNVILKLHNFRYDCARSFFSSKHLGKENLCKACGMDSDKVGIFNKYYEDSFAKSLLVNNFGRKYFKLIQNKKLKILTLTNHHKDYLIELGISKKNIFVYPNPSPYLYKPQNDNQKKLNQIIYAGRISKEKGLLELVNTWNSIKNNDFKLKIIGEGPLFKELQDITSSSDSIHLIGYLDNEKVAHIIKESKAVVTATKLFEGQPTLLCEASSLSVPSIFPSAGGMKDFFPKNYEFTFDQYDYKDLGKKLEQIIKLSNIEKVAKENHDHIKKYLDEERLFITFNEILESK
tara:strand:+ start:775 stop:1935 length:1161 start_codon:yes stop_codon:yes gene_type:complete